MASGRAYAGRGMYISIYDAEKRAYVLQNCLLSIGPSYSSNNCAVLAANTFVFRTKTMVLFYRVDVTNEKAPLTEILRFPSSATWVTVVYEVTHFLIYEVVPRRDWQQSTSALSEREGVWEAQARPPRYSGQPPSYASRSYLSKIDLSGNVVITLHLCYPDQKLADLEGIHFSSFASTPWHLFASAQSSIFVFRWDNGQLVSRIFGGCMSAPRSDSVIFALGPARILCSTLSTVSLLDFSMPASPVSVICVTPPAMGHTAAEPKIESMMAAGSDLYHLAAKGANVPLRQIICSTVSTSGDTSRIVAYYSGDENCWTEPISMGIRLPLVVPKQRPSLPSDAVTDSDGSSIQLARLIGLHEGPNDTPNSWRLHFNEPVASLRGAPVCPSSFAHWLGMDAIYGKVYFAKQTKTAHSDGPTAWQFTSLQRSEIDSLLDRIELIESSPVPKEVQDMAGEHKRQYRHSGNPPASMDSL